MGAPAVQGTHRRGFTWFGNHRIMKGCFVLRHCPVVVLRLTRARATLRQSPGAVHEPPSPRCSDAPWAHAPFHSFGWRTLSACRACFLATILVSRRCARYGVSPEHQRDAPLEVQRLSDNRCSRAYPVACMRSILDSAHL
ncbi:hypothetical protein TRVL_10026 [Trypanosoma vivax]|nr:hypothetical protein TRVL_10026 [Trypanosoma vivax]